MRGSSHDVSSVDGNRCRLLGVFDARAARAARALARRSRDVAFPPSAHKQTSYNWNFRQLRSCTTLQTSTSRFPLQLLYPSGPLFEPCRRRSESASNPYHPAVLYQQACLKVNPYHRLKTRVSFRSLQKFVTRSTNWSFRPAPPCGYSFYCDQYFPVKDGEDPVYKEYLLTCKQINAEATHYLFKHNIFYFNDCKLASQWLFQIGARNASAIKELILKLLLPQWSLASLKKIFRKGIGLRSLRLVGCTLDRAEDKSACVKQFLLRVKPWLDRHPSLNLAISPYTRAIQSERLGPQRYWHTIDITFAANENYIPLRNQHYCIDLESELQGMKNDSENHPFCCRL